MAAQKNEMEDYMRGIGFRQRMTEARKATEVGDTLRLTLRGSDGRLTRKRFCVTGVYEKFALVESPSGTRTCMLWDDVAKAMGGETLEEGKE